MSETIDNSKAGGRCAPAPGSASGRTHLDLFSGIGGFALAASWAGWTTIGFAETDDYASKVLKRHWPNVPNFGDVRNIRNVRADLITGGFPCQPYSVTGKRTGNADHRALWPEMLRVIRESKPSWVLGENVSGIVSMELDKICADLEAEGYEVQPLLIPACAADAPQERMRCWILADATGARGQSKPGGVYQDAGQTRTQTNGHQQPISGRENGSLNPEWAEWLMGYPIGWTDCAASATPSFRKSRLKSCARSESAMRE